MNLDASRIRQWLRAFDFSSLFIEGLGWDRHSGVLEMQVDGRTLNLSAVAHKRGMAVYVCPAAARGSVPDYATRRRIERQVTKSVHEHLIIYTDAAKTMQVWQWVKRELGKPTACREHTYHTSQPGEALIQKLRYLLVTLEEEEKIALPEMTGRTKKAFDVERVTKRFYDRFKTEHDAFLKFIEGIPDEDLERWYVSVMLNRLMFIYFIQKKGFLDNNPNYLRDKLNESKQRRKDRYYRDLLCPLFFEGFAKRPQNRSAETNRLLGKVPYLNGGIFQMHEIEEKHGKTIRIPDKVFEKLFDFFEQYQWHLDDRPTSRDNEIRPDVLGYIFEKYINQKQMGAYYTKEDITGYISQNTVIPRLFDMAREKCRIAFESGTAAPLANPTVWELPRENPDRYIYPAVRHGITLDIQEAPPRPLEKPLPLPKEIDIGLDTTKPKLLERRKEWNKSAPSEYALPAETWRELVARRTRYEELRAKLDGGKVHDINDLITYNLDIRQFAQDVIENAEGPELVRAFWRAINKITVLDPACGSGAFLFAALNILEPLYEACLGRMQGFVDEYDCGAGFQPAKHGKAGKMPAPEEVVASSEPPLTAGSCLLKRLEVAKVVQNALLHFEGSRYKLGAWSIMPNHMHVVVTPIGEHSLSDILHSWKSFTANEINMITGRTGTVWERESFDHLIRSAEDVARFASYIAQNPVTAGLCARPEDWPFSSCGVRFQPAPIDFADPRRTPVAPLRSRGELPHLHKEGGTYFVTFRLADTVSREKGAGKMPAPQKRKFADFREVLRRTAEHPNERYFIFKSIVVNNLYGVDIMEEAVEICKLRLFLKLVAQIERVEDLEPLPDIDFNIRAGNTLVGFASLDEVKKTQAGKLGFAEKEIARIEEEAEITDRAFQQFRRQQTELGGTVTAEDKRKLGQRLSKLAGELDRYLAGEYGIDVESSTGVPPVGITGQRPVPRSTTFEKWRASHKPFHWFAEFYGIIHEGGFDVMIGNPPYVETRNVREYKPRGFATEGCGDLYALVLERSSWLSIKQGRVGFIVPMSCFSVERFVSLQTTLRAQMDTLFISNWSGDAHPSKLFEGVNKRLEIVLGRRAASVRQESMHVSKYLKWYSEERPALFTRHPLYLVVSEPSQVMMFGTSMPKLGSVAELEIIAKLRKCNRNIGSYVSPVGQHQLYYTRKVSFFLQFLDFIPTVRDKGGSKRDPSELKVLTFADAATRDMCLACLTSSLFYWFNTINSDCRNLNKREIILFPVPDRVPTSVLKKLTNTLACLMKDYKDNSSLRTVKYVGKGAITVQYFNFRPSKPIIDEIDRVLAQHYGFTDEELDFIINYDIKYRMGKADNEGESE